PARCRSIRRFAALCPARMKGRANRGVLGSPARWPLELETPRAAETGKAPSIVFRSAWLRRFPGPVPLAGRRPRQVGLRQRRREGSGVSYVASWGLAPCLVANGADPRGLLRAPN